MVRSRRPLGLVVGGIGLVWLGQGIGWIPGSFMTGSPFWAVIGALCVIAGGILILRDKRRK